MQKWFVFGRDADLDAALRFLEQRRYGEAAMHLDICLGRPIDSGIRRLARQMLVSALVHLASNCLKENHALEALPLMRKAVNLEPDYPDLLVRLAALEVLSGGQDLSVQHLESALQINPKYDMALALHDAVTSSADPFDWEEFTARYPNLAKLRATTTVREDATASETIAAIIWAEPNREQIEDAKAEAMGAEPDQAREILIPLVNRYPAFADLRYALGQAYLAGDKLDDAMAHLSKAVLLNPRYADAYSALGIVFRRTGRSDEAKSAFEAALAVDPSHPVAREEILRL